MKKLLIAVLMLSLSSAAFARHGGGHGGGFHGGGHGGYHGGGRGWGHGGDFGGGYYGGRRGLIAPAVIGTGLTAAALAAGENGNTYYDNAYYY